MFRSFWATVAVIFALSSIHVVLVSASPTRNHRTLRLHRLDARLKRLEGRAPPFSPHQELPLFTQAAAWATVHSTSQDAKGGDGANPTYRLPPVAEVFKMIADAESSKRVASKSPPVSTPAPMVAAALVPTKTTMRSVPQSTEQPQPEHTPYLAPGLAVVPTSTANSPPAIPPSPVPQTTLPNLPPVSQATSSSAPPGTQVTPSTAGLQRNGAPARKLIVIGGIMAGLIVLLFIVYVFFDRHIFVCCKRTKDEPEHWTKINSPPPPTRSFNEHMEKSDIDTVYTPPWMQLSNSSSSSQGSPSPETKARSFDLVSACDRDFTPVMDISSSYPRSKFSVCSSEYPASASLASTTRTSGASLVSGSHYSPSAESHTPSNNHRSPILPAYEFFCIPLSESEDNHHMRAHSAPMPIFGHSVVSESPGVMVRSLDHRKSRSVSGLTYTVPPNRGSACSSQQSGSEMEQSQRGSGSSAGGDHWRLSPVQMSNGWPSAL
ncbi:hypothetical protein DXG03_007929 [Asterophora parasitica]|uniref:Uncharacterized protein n=1 Tax=Asterophora parasitica TaxID=117018 RepID=A0A9P7G7L8_9AGAR|nr:hypothetical protein DXG03_007929 [Asterophora parasitica]